MISKINPPKSLVRLVQRAQRDYHLIQKGDRVLLGLSGGKDSLSLLHLLAHFKFYNIIQFELGVVSVDPMFEGFDLSPLVDYVESLGIPIYLCKHSLATRAEQHMQNNSFCSFCARMKRGIIYATARKHGYNVIALAQHLDDLAESFLMSAFHEGALRTMKANYINDEGDLRIIRPLIYVRERQTRAFARDASLPVIKDNCPACFAMPSQRVHMKELLKIEEQGNKNLYKNLLSAMRPLLINPRQD